jgi:hypothetical protein
MTIYIVITASLVQEMWDIRYEQYIKGITQTISVFKDIPNVKFIIVENTGRTSSFLDQFGIPVLYTNTNNSIQTKNRGTKELLDVFEAIKFMNMKDDDFIVKVTGRYSIHTTSPFITALKQLDTHKYDAILKYGSYNSDVIHTQKYYSCITGLIGMRVQYVKSIEIPDEVTCVEWKWAEASYAISDENICSLERLGIDQCISISHPLIFCS